MILDSLIAIILKLWGTLTSNSLVASFLNPVIANLDIIIYSLSLCFLMADFTNYMAFLDLTTFNYIRSSIQSFLWTDLEVLCGLIVTVPTMMCLYYWATGSGSDCLSITRGIIQTWGSTVIAVLKRLFQLSTGPIVAAFDPNSTLTPHEKLFFAQIYSDDQSQFIDLSNLTPPFPRKKNGDYIPYGKSYSSPNGKSYSSPNGPSPYETVAFPDLNLEFYNDPNHRKEAYAEYFTTVPTYMSRIDYICLPYKVLKDQDAILQKFRTAIINLLNLTSSVTSLSDIEDSVLSSYASGITSCPGSIPWPGASHWPHLPANFVKNPVMPDGSSPPSPLGTDILSNLYRITVNEAFIYYTIESLIYELTGITDGYNESINRLAIYANICGADHKTSTNFNLNLDELKAYTYTFSNDIKQVVLSSPVDGNSILPITVNTATIMQSNDLYNLYNVKILSELNHSSNATSSANLFAVADTTLELLGCGVDFDIIKSLYLNTRGEAITSLFDISNNRLDPLYVLTQSTFGVDYTESAFLAVQQESQALSAIARDISTDKIAIAIAAAPTHNLSNTTDVGGPYIRRVFYNAAGLLDDVCSTLFAIFKKNVTSNTIATGHYTPKATDPLDMMWFRCAVQNWSNPLTGGSGDLLDNYLAGGYTVTERANHVKSMQGIFSDLEKNLINNTNGQQNILDKIKDLIDYVVVFNNIVDQAFSNGILGSHSSAIRSQIMSQLSSTYLRLDQNQRYMSLLSLTPVDYSHFHINLPLDIKLATPTAGSLSALQKPISNIADLATFMKTSMTLNPNYQALKTEVANTFLIKSVLDMVWWPTFCSQYYYKTVHLDEGNRYDALTSVAVDSLNHRFVQTVDTSNNVADITDGYLFKSYQPKTDSSGNQIYDSNGHKIYDMTDKSGPIIQSQNIAYGLINQGMEGVFSDFSRIMANHITKSIISLPNLSASINTQNGVPFTQMCNAYRHDAILGYVYWTCTINDLDGSVGNVYLGNLAIQTFNQIHGCNGGNRTQDGGYNDKYAKFKTQNFCGPQQSNNFYDHLFNNLNTSNVQDDNPNGADDDNDPQLWMNIVPGKALYINNLANNDHGGSYRWLSLRTSIGGDCGPNITGQTFPMTIPADPNSPSSFNRLPKPWAYTKFAQTVGNNGSNGYFNNYDNNDYPTYNNNNTYGNPQWTSTETLRWQLRLSFFADPMSWFDTNRSYQIYPMSYCSDWVNAETSMVTVTGTPMTGFDPTQNSNAYAPMIKTDWDKKTLQSSGIKGSMLAATAALAAATAAAGSTTTAGTVGAIPTAVVAAATAALAKAQVTVAAATLSTATIALTAATLAATTALTAATTAGATVSLTEAQAATANAAVAATATGDATATAILAAAQAATEALVAVAAATVISSAATVLSAAQAAIVAAVITTAAPSIETAALAAAAAATLAAVAATAAATAATITAASQTGTAAQATTTALAAKALATAATAAAIAAATSSRTGAVMKASIRSETGQSLAKTPAAVEMEQRLVAVYQIAAAQKAADAAQIVYGTTAASLKTAQGWQTTAAASLATATAASTGPSGAAQAASAAFTLALNAATTEATKALAAMDAVTALVAAAGLVTAGATKIVVTYPPLIASAQTTYVSAYAATKSQPSANATTAFQAASDKLTGLQSTLTAAINAQPGLVSAAQAAVTAVTNAQRAAGIVPQGATDAEKTAAVNAATQGATDQETAAITTAVIAAQAVIAAATVTQAVAAVATAVGKAQIATDTAKTQAGIAEAAILAAQGGGAVATAVAQTFAALATTKAQAIIAAQAAIDAQTAATTAAGIAEGVVSPEIAVKIAQLQTMSPAQAGAFVLNMPIPDIVAMIVLMTPEQATETLRQLNSNGLFAQFYAAGGAVQAAAAVTTEQTRVATAAIQGQTATKRSHSSYLIIETILEPAYSQGVIDAAAQSISSGHMVAAPTAVEIATAQAAVAIAAAIAAPGDSAKEILAEQLAGAIVGAQIDARIASLTAEVNGMYAGSNGLARNVYEAINDGHWSADEAHIVYSILTWNQLVDVTNYALSFPDEGADLPGINDYMASPAGQAKQKEAAVLAAAAAQRLIDLAAEAVIALVRSLTPEQVPIHVGDWSIDDVKRVIVIMTRDQAIQALYTMQCNNMGQYNAAISVLTSAQVTDYLAGVETERQRQAGLANTAATAQTIQADAYRTEVAGMSGQSLYEALNNTTGMNWSQEKIYGVIAILTPAQTKAVNDYGELLYS